MNRRRSGLVVALACCAVPLGARFCLAAEAVPTGAHIGTLSDFQEKLLIAAGSCVISFIGAWFLAEQKYRREVKKQLSYVTIIQSGLISIHAAYRDQIKASFGDQPVKDLTYVTCTVENTGNTVVRNQTVRLSFPDETTFLGEFLEPKPEPEMQVEKLREPGLGRYERKFRIGHIERSEKVGFHFLVSADHIDEIPIHGHNDSGDVQFVPRSTIRIAKESDLIARFVYLCLLFILVPTAVNLYSVGIVGELLATITRLIVLAFIFPLIRPMSDTIAKIVENAAKEREVTARSESSDSLVGSDYDSSFFPWLHLPRRSPYSLFDPSLIYSVGQQAGASQPTSSQGDKAEATKEGQSPRLSFTKTSTEQHTHSREPSTPPASANTETPPSPGTSTSGTPPEGA